MPNLLKKLFKTKGKKKTKNLIWKMGKRHEQTTFLTIEC